MNFMIFAVFLFQSFFLVLANPDLKTVDQKAHPETNITHEASTQENATSTVLLKENKTLPIDSVKNISLEKGSVQVEFHNTTIAPNSLNTTVSPPISSTTPSSTTANTSTTTSTTTISPNATTPNNNVTNSTQTTTTPVVPTTNITTTTASPTTNGTTQLVLTTSVLPEISTPVPQSRQFDGPSFIGGIVLTVGLTAIGFIAFKFYKADRVPKSENYRQL